MIQQIQQSDSGMLFVDNVGHLTYWQRPHLASQYSARCGPSPRSAPHSRRPAHRHPSNTFFFFFFFCVLRSYVLLVKRMLLWLRTRKLLRLRVSLRAVVGVSLSVTRANSAGSPCPRRSPRALASLLALFTVGDATVRAQAATTALLPAVEFPVLALAAALHGTPLLRDACWLAEKRIITEIEEYLAKEKTFLLKKLQNSKLFSSIYDYVKLRKPDLR